jgi:uncharacterized membrane protein
VHSDNRGTRSTAAIFGHPIHPMLVVFPIGFLVGALATDLAFWGTSDPFWARASKWLLGAGIVMGVLAAVAGLIEFVTISRVRSLAAGWVHFLGNATAILLSVWNLLHRMSSSDAGAGVVPFGVTLSAVVVVIFLITGWLGGELVFRHRIGMIDDKSEELSSAAGTPVERIPITGIDLSHAGKRKTTAAAPTLDDRSKLPM